MWRCSSRSATCTSVGGSSGGGPEGFGAPQIIMDAALAALNCVAVEMRKVVEEVVAARATCEGLLKEAKAVVERCEDVETHLIALKWEHAKLVEQRRSQEEELKAREAKLAAREGDLSRKARRLDTE